MSASYTDRVGEGLIASVGLSTLALLVGAVFGLAWQAAVSTLVVTVVLWPAVTRKAVTQVRGALVGALVGILAHPLCW